MHIVGQQNQSIHALNQPRITEAKESILPAHLRKHLSQLKRANLLYDGQLSNQLLRLLDASGDCV